MLRQSSTSVYPVTTLSPASGVLLTVVVSRGLRSTQGVSDAGDTGDLYAGMSLKPLLRLCLRTYYNTTVYHIVLV